MRTVRQVSLTTLPSILRRCRRWLLDGFPRTEAQASAIKAAGASPTVVLLVDVPDDVLVVRAVCPTPMD